MSQLLVRVSRGGRDDTGQVEEGVRADDRVLWEKYGQRVGGRGAGQVPTCGHGEAQDGASSRQSSAWGGRRTDRRDQTTRSSTWSQQTNVNINKKAQESVIYGLILFNLFFVSPFTQKDNLDIDKKVKETPLKVSENSEIIAFHDALGSR